MMGDLSCCGAQASPAVEVDRTEPDRSAVVSFFKNQPQTDVVPLVGAPAIRLLESELLLFALIIKRADRRIVVWPGKHHAADALDTRRQCNWDGRKTAGRVHSAKDIFFAADEP